MRTGGRVLVDTLIRNGADTIFGVPGESYLDALDAVAACGNAIRFITCRQEGGASFAADTYTALTGKPAICFVTRGPGVTNASIGVHAAHQASTSSFGWAGSRSHSASPPTLRVVLGERLARGSAAQGQLGEEVFTKGLHVSRPEDESTGLGG